MKQPDESVLARLREDPHDQQAWSEFYEQFRPRVAGVLFFLGARQPDLDDLTAEAFFRFLARSPWCQNWQSLPPSDKVLSYLAGAASSVASHAREKLLRRPPEVTDEAVLDALPGSDPGDLPFLGFEYVLQQLAPEDRQLVIDYHERGMSITELARLYRISYEAAGVRLHRVRRKILTIIREKPFPKR